MSGNGHLETLDFTEAPKRVVSLVPSMTDSIYELGAGQSLVGVTEFCPVPIGLDKPPAIVGGTKTADPDLIVDLRPDLIIANQEENARETVEALEARDQPVWVTFPRSVRQALNLLYTLVRLFRLSTAVSRLQTLELTLDWADRSTPLELPRVFCPIWYQAEGDFGPWWMVANEDTYHYDLLLKCSGRGLFPKRKRKYPLAADLGQAQAEPAGDRDQRYPRVRTEQVITANPQVILLPSEPFEFGQEHVELIGDLFAETAAVVNDRVHLIDGRWMSWHGTMMARALAELPGLLEPDSAAEPPA